MESWKEILETGVLKNWRRMAQTSRLDGQNQRTPKMCQKSANTKTNSIIMSKPGPKIKAAWVPLSNRVVF